jgi:hypothetical protein
MQVKNPCVHTLSKKSAARVNWWIIPNAGDMALIYESPDGGNIVYQRESGSSERELIRDARTSDGRPLHEHMMENQLWGNIRRAARTDPALHAALERVKILYYLSMENGNNT